MIKMVMMIKMIKMIKMTLIIKVIKMIKVNKTIKMIKVIKIFNTLRIIKNIKKKTYKHVDKKLGIWETTDSLDVSRLKHQYQKRVWYELESLPSKKMGAGSNSIIFFFPFF